MACYWSQFVVDTRSGVVYSGYTDLNERGIEMTKYYIRCTYDKIELYVSEFYAYQFPEETPSSLLASRKNFYDYKEAVKYAKELATNNGLKFKSDEIHDYLD